MTTLCSLVKQLSSIGSMLTSGEVPILINGKPLSIKEISLKGEGGDYYVEIKTK